MTVTHTNPSGLHALPDLITQVVTAPATRLVLLSGQVAWDEHGRLVGAGDHGAQAARVAANLDVALAAVGATRRDVVKETLYVVDWSPALLPEVFGPLRAGVARPPASTLVPVPALFAPGFLLEVEVVAVLPGPGAPGAPGT
ncbi:RidA family protein [Kineococcus sp. NUM-3379]